MKRAARLILLSVIAVLMAVTQSTVSAAEPQSSSEPSLIGPWRTAAMVHRGKRTPARETRMLLFTFGDGQATVHLGPKLLATTACTVNGQADPKQIDLELDGQKTLGIWQIAKGTLTIRANDPARGRPKDFDAASDVELNLRRADRGFNYLHIMNVDGSGQRVLVAPPEFTAVGSPEWSRDGRRIAFDGWRSLYGEGARLAHVFVCGADGSELKDLGLGAMPTWSPDGQRIAFSSYEPHGVWTMKADGTDRKLLDADGWAVEWCPVGDRVAYTTYGDGAANVRVHDLATGKTHDLLDDRYFYVYYGMSWSPDGQQIALVGRKSDGVYELAVVHADGHKKGFRVVVPTAKSEGFRPAANASWSPDGRQVLASLAEPGKPSALYAVDVDAPHAMRRLPGQPEDRAYANPAWSPDGKTIVFTTAKDLTNRNE